MIAIQQYVCIVFSIVFLTLFLVSDSDCDTLLNPSSSSSGTSYCSTRNAESWVWAHFYKIHWYTQHTILNSHLALMLKNVKCSFLRNTRRFFLMIKKLVFCTCVCVCVRWISFYYIFFNCILHPIYLPCLKSMYVVLAIVTLVLGFHELEISK